MNLRYVTCNTPDGEFHMIVDGDNVVRASGFGSLLELEKRLPKELQTVDLAPVQYHIYSQFIADYYSGDETALLKIKHAQTGSDFQKRVWQAIGEIPYGKTISYKKLAERVGNPAALRAAGTVCGLNRLILLVPCHRVVKTGGGIGSYLYGSELKESLLRREGVI